MIKIVHSTPPEITQWFSKDLLARPLPKFRQDSEDLEIVRKNIIDSLWHKLDKLPKKKKKCEEVLKGYKKLYERIIEKEKEQEGKTNYKTQMPFYFFGSIGSEGDDIFRRLKYNARTRHA